jgi:hypothetical protein
MRCKWRKLKAWRIAVLLALFASLAGWSERAHAAGLLVADGGFGGVLELRSRTCV